jgi:hypothetical protein
VRNFLSWNKKSGRKRRWFLRAACISALEARSVMVSGIDIQKLRFRRLSQIGIALGQLFDISEESNPATWRFGGTNQLILRLQIHGEADRA